jgi:phage terminase large subunit-like protein
MTPWQLEIFRAFDDGLARFFLLCWHRRARKTTFGLNLLVREAWKHPQSIYGYIAPTYTQAKAIVWRDPNMLFKYTPRGIIARQNESELVVELTNRSIVVVKGADNPDAIRGQDYCGVFCDEWALFKPMVWEEILRPIIAQNKKRWAVFAFTPKGRNFVYDYWMKCDAWPQWYKSLLTVETSGMVDEEELRLAAQEMPTELYNQEFLCSFLADEERTLIPAASVESLRGVKVYHRNVRRVVSCDPSQGGDECVIYCIENTRVIETKILHIEDPLAIAGEVAAMMYRTNTDVAAVDSIGIGSGVYYKLRELGKKVIDINSAVAASEPERFTNLRTEMWWYVMEQIRDKAVEYPADPELRRELSSVKYKPITAAGKIGLEPKTDTKDYLGRSPDRADAFVYGIWALRQVPALIKDAWKEEKRSDEIGSGATSFMAA